MVLPASRSSQSLQPTKKPPPGPPGGGGGGDGKTGTQQVSDAHTPGAAVDASAVDAK